MSATQKFDSEKPPSQTNPDDLTQGYSSSKNGSEELGETEPYTGRRSSLRASFAASVQSKRKQGYEHDDPYGDEEGAETKYRTLEWWQGGLIMIAETVSLGILSLPSVLNRVGLVPGIILIIGLGAVATYTGYVIGQFKQMYPQVHTFAEAGEILFAPIGWGRFGKELFGTSQAIFWVFTMGSHLLTFTVMLNTVTEHATCTIVWSVIGLVVFWSLNIPRTLKAVSWMSLVSFISIVSACLIVMIGLGVNPRNPSKAVSATKTGVEFATAFNSISNIVFAFSGHTAFFNFISELKNPKDFTKSLILLQTVDITMYIVVAVVIYIYAGADVTSPALGSATTVVKKVAWGIAIPTILIGGVVFGHVATKYVYVRLFRGTKHMGAVTVFSIGTWLGISLAFWLVAWIIAESIPVFNDLLAFAAALFASWFTYGISGMLWLHMNWHQLFINPRKIFLTFLNFAIIGLGIAVFGIGLYASGKAIHDDAKIDGGNTWTCKNNGQ